MPPVKIAFVLPKDCPAQRLDQALFSYLPGLPEVTRTGIVLSKGKIRKLIIAGAVYIGGGRVRIASKSVRPGMRLEVYLDPLKLLSESERGGVNAVGGNRTCEWKLGPESILFEDEWIIGVAKPAGLPTQPTLDEARANLYALLKKYLAERDGPECYVGLHHRLDRDTSGVMIFTKKKEANAAVGRLFAEHLAQKTYLALVATGNARWQIGQTWQVDNFLARDRGKAGKMQAVRSGGDRAITDFRVLDVAPGSALVEAKPRTGRMHQIRVHLATAGTPIYGDRTYGYRAEAGGVEIPRVMLHAVALSFPHPITQVRTVFEAPITAASLPSVSDFQLCFRQLFGRELRS